VVDATGAIYVIGGYSRSSGITLFQDTYFNDVWASTDGGSRPDSVKGLVVLRGCYEGYYRGTMVLQGSYN
jgi:hypothetical protein